MPPALSILVALYLGGLTAANALAAKLFVIGGVHVTSGALAIPLVYICTDLLNELYGRAVTTRVVWMGLFSNAVLVAMTLAAGAVPASPLGADQATFEAVFAVTPRVVLGSSLAYLVSSLVDVWAFQEIKAWTGERYFWLRKNGSTMISQALDTAVFVVVAFGWSMPWEALVLMGLGQYIVKVSMAPLGTPLSYAVLTIARRWK